MDFAVGWYDIAGAIGVTLIIGSYALVQLGRLDATDRRYSLLNFVGAGLVLVSLVFDFNLSAFVVEAFWALLSLVGLIRPREAGEGSA